jgi:hypothetical protein
VSSKNNAKKKEKTQRLEEKEKGKRRMQQTTHSKKTGNMYKKYRLRKLKTTHDDHKLVQSEQHVFMLNESYCLRGN